MARLLADEQYPIAIVNAIRLLGHDAQTVRQTSSNPAGDGIGDEDILRMAKAASRIVITCNRKDFAKLHKAQVVGGHRGIIACPLLPDVAAKTQAKGIHAKLQSVANFKNQFVTMTARELSGFQRKRGRKGS